MEVEEMEGRLLDADKVKKLYLSQLSQIATKIEEFPARFEQVVPKASKRVNGAIQDLIEEVMDEIKDMKP